MQGEKKLFLAVAFIRWHGIIHPPMNTLLESLYHLLSFILEDAQANNVPGFRSIPAPILSSMESLMSELEKHLYE